MKNKGPIYILIFIVLVVFILELRVYLNQINLNGNPEKQIKETDSLIENNSAKSDSIESLQKEKEVVIQEKEKLLYDNVAKAKNNNIRYEKIKKSIGNTNDADSLARMLSNRYSKR